MKWNQRNVPKSKQKEKTRQRARDMRDKTTIIITKYQWTEKKPTNEISWLNDRLIAKLQVANENINSEKKSNRTKFWSRTNMRKVDDYNTSTEHRIDKANNNDQMTIEHSKNRIDSRLGKLFIYRDDVCCCSKECEPKLFYFNPFPEAVLISPVTKSRQTNVFCVDTDTLNKYIIMKMLFDIESRLSIQLFRCPFSCRFGWQRDSNERQIRHFTGNGYLYLLIWCMKIGISDDVHENLKNHRNRLHEN